MSSYEIQPYTHLMAYKYGVKAVVSKNPTKEIDVLDFNDNYICSIPDIRYGAFPTYYKTRGERYAFARRRLFHLRNRNSEKIRSKGYYAAHLLW